MALGTPAHRAPQRATGALPAPGSCCLGLRQLQYKQPYHSHGPEWRATDEPLLSGNAHATVLPGNTVCQWPCRAGEAAHMQQLRLDVAAALMPHPAKAHRGGEDAVFLSDDGLTFGEHMLLQKPGRFLSSAM